MNEKELLKKKIEKRDIEGILSYLNIPEEQCDWLGDEPDCRYTTEEGRIIGIEIVRCSNGRDIPRQMFRLFLGACDYCENELKKEGWKDKSITVFFFDKWLWKRPKLKTPEFYKVIKEEVVRHLKYDDYINGVKFISDIDGYRLLDKQGAFDYHYVESISVVDARDSVTVSTIISSFVSDVNKEVLNECIEDKNQKLQKYLISPINTNIKEYWLFISLDWNSYTSLGIIDLPVVDNEFDRIYICEGNHVQQLK